VEEFKRRNHDIKVIVVGCMAERLGCEIKKRFSSVDLVIGAKDIVSAAPRIMSLYRAKNFASEKMNLDVKSEIVRYVPVMRGCNNYCSYCIVPYVRGAEKSYNYRSIIKECSSMVENGAREIVLLGQNVNSYKYENINFPSLIEKIAAIKNLERIRFMTNHPKDLSDGLISIMAAEPKVCPHIHLPIQSASDKILRLMNRSYTYKHYLDLIGKLRIAVPDISVTTDIIVGFPGETDKDFEYTLSAVKAIRFSRIYVFKYSPRPNTKAAEMADDVSVNEKKIRHAAILEESNKISIEIVSKMLGSTQKVLAEKIENDFIEAKTRDGHKVFVKGSREYYGKIFGVCIKEAKTNSLFGSIE
jgi:tRNA-2-methylthio-N6-dimethylallyladenosine synthase